MRGGFFTGRGGPIAALAVFGLIAGLALSIACGPVCAQEGAASRASQQPSFGIPLAPWTAEAVAGLRSEFVDGVAAQVLGVAEGHAAGEVRGLASTSDELVGEGDRIWATMNRIGTIDSSFGIDGISRLATAGNAQRDTLFGLVVWHESVAGGGKQIARELEDAVVGVKDLATRARRHAAEIAEGSDVSRSALGEGQFADLESSSSAVVQATVDLITVSDRLQEQASRLEEAVWTIQGDDETPLDVEWKKVLLSVSEVRRLAGKLRSAVESFELSSDVLWRVTEALGGVVETTEALSGSAPNPVGTHHVSAEVLERDVAIARELEATVLSEAQNGYPDEAQAAIRALLGKLIAADAILATRAVEHSSTEVARAVDALEGFYGTVAGYNENDPERRRAEALSKIDLALRDNGDLRNARLSARSARAALDDGAQDQARGAGSETQALANYVSAWGHAVDAGASARAAVRTMTSR